MDARTAGAQTIERHSGAALVQARRLYRAALVCGWVLEVLDLFDGVISAKGIGSNAGRRMFARRVNADGYWCAGIEYAGTEQARVGRRGDITIVDRWKHHHTTWFRGSDGRRSMSGVEMVRSLVDHMRMNAALPPMDRVSRALSAAPTQGGEETEG